jgi:hypothetical protein
MNIYGDGKLIQSVDLKSNIFAEPITVDVTGVRLLKFEMPDVDGNGADYAFTQMVLTKDNNAPEETNAQVFDRNSLVLGKDLSSYQNNNYQEQTDTIMGGITYSNVLVFSEKSYYGDSYANFNLDKQYLSISGIYGHIDGSEEYEATLNIYGDGKLITSYDLKSNMFSETITIDVKGVRQLKFVMPDINGNGAAYALSGMVLTADPDAPPLSTKTEVDRNAVILGTDVDETESNNYREEPTALLGGIKQYNALVFSEKSYYGDSYATYNLDGNYSKITGIYGHVDGTEEYDTTVYIYGDGKLINTIDLSSNIFAEDIVIDITGVKVLKIEMPDINGNGAEYAFCNMTLE